MSKHVAFLHTSAVHIETFDRLVAALDPSMKVEHFVDEALLADAQRVGAADPALVNRVHQAMSRAASNGASMVVCSCSTIGSAAERTLTAGRFGVARIDRAMADRAVTLGPKILIVATVESTIGPTRTLIEESAASGAGIEIEQFVVDGAWSSFLRGDQQAYIEAIAAGVKARTPLAADVIVLAQASMAPAAELLAGMGVEVLSSPRLGVQNLVDQLSRRDSTIT